MGKIIYKKTALVKTKAVFPEDVAERGKEFVERVTENYPRLVGGMAKPKSEHKWKPPEVPRKLRQIFDAGWYTKVLTSGRNLLPETAAISSHGKQRVEKRSFSDEMSKALNMLDR